MTKQILLTIGILGTIILGLIIFGVSIMGDRFCKIQLQNQRLESLSVKTIKSTGNEWTMIVDSVAIGPNEKLGIGDCINCAAIDKSDFDFDAIVLFESNKRPKLILRKDLIDYLGKLEKVGCATFLVR
jgi:hypothetical protein